MISSLEDAKKWHDSVRTLAQDMDRLGVLFWDRATWAEELGRDNRFRSVESADIIARARMVSEDLDDLGVLLLFSVFESMVRDRAWGDIERSLRPPLHPAVAHAVQELKNDIEGGSFGRVTDAYKGLDAGLIEEVNQVRRYRNWVAHGRRGVQPDFVDPRRAYERLNRFLEKMAELTIVSPAEP